MMPAETLERFERVLAQAKATGNTDVYDKTMLLFLEAVRVTAPPPGTVLQTRARPHHARARAREAAASDNAERQADGLHKLRAGREQCTATRRDGAPCEAPAIPGGLVCKRHGGGAPRVKIAAQHRQLEEAVWMAYADWQEVRRSGDGFEAVCKITHAERELGKYELKMRLLSELRAWIRSRRTTATPETAPARPSNETVP